MHESAHMQWTGSTSKFREHEKIDRKGEIREMKQITLRSTMTCERDGKFRGRAGEVFAHGVRVRVSDFWALYALPTICLHYLYMLNIQIILLTGFCIPMVNSLKTTS